MPETKPASRGNNIFEFLVARTDLEAARRVIRARAEGKCLIGEEPQGNQVKLTIILYSDTPERDTEGILEDLARSKVEVHRYEAGQADAEADF